MWYAIQCDVGGGSHPVSFAGACNAGPKNPCFDCPAPEGFAQRADEHLIDSDLNAGYTRTGGGGGGFMAKGIPLMPAEVTVKSGDQTPRDLKIYRETVTAVNEVVRANIDGAFRYFHLVTVTTGPAHSGPNKRQIDAVRYRLGCGKLTIKVGYEVATGDDNIVADNVKPHPQGNGIRTITFGGDDYVVLLKKAGT